MDELTPAEAKALQEALLAAYPSRSALEQMVYFELEQNLNAVVSGGSLVETIFALIGWAKTAGKVDALVAGARRANPGNPKLRAFEKAFLERRRGPEPSVDGTRGLSQAARRALIEALLDVPATVSFEGRSALLIGMPWAQSMNRSPTNARVDLELIVDQLLSIGASGAGGVPPYAIFLDNAESYVAGTELAKVFREARESLGKRG